MLEAKYKAWDKVLRRFVPVACLYFDKNSNFIGVFTGEEIDEEWTVVDKKHLELIQYTGLKDKNGQEIYIGDVLRLVLTDFAGVPAYNFVVRFDPYDIVYLYQIDEFIKNNDTSDYFEVIGNIYEKQGSI